MKNNNVQVVTGYKKPAKPGIHYRLVCMTGNNKGISYYLKSVRVILGRGDTADIQIIDPKSSREHAELSMVQGSFVVTDLGSQNGVVVNDLKITQHTLKDNDNIIIGKTVFKYNIVNVEEVEEKSELQEDDEFIDNENEPKSAGGKRKLIIYGLVLLVGAYVMLGDDQSENPKAKKVKSDATLNEGLANIRRKSSRELDRDVRDNLAAIIHRGQREYREGNLFRAISEFNLALVLDPKNGQAQYYRDKAIQALDDEVNKSFMSARRAEDALKYKQSIVDYCSILRLLEGYKDDERYKSAEDKKKKVEEKLGLENEIECL